MFCSFSFTYGHNPLQAADVTIKKFSTKLGGASNFVAGDWLALNIEEILRIKAEQAAAEEQIRRLVPLFVPAFLSRCASAKLRESCCEETER